jgi:hypothetical protein
MIKKKISNRKPKKSTKTKTSLVVAKFDGAFIPKLNEIRRQTTHQYDLTRNLLENIHDITTTRQLQIEESIGGVKDEVKLLRVEQDAGMQRFGTTLDSFSEKFDSHVDEERKRFDELFQAIDSNNGGVTNSVGKIYTKLAELEMVTQGARARAKFWTVLHDVVVSTPILKPLKYKWGAVFYGIIFLVVLNTVAHAFGINLDLISIFKLINFGG